MPLDLVQLLTPQEVAALLKVSTGTLAQWRFHRRVELPYLKISSAVRYRKQDVEAFIAKAVSR